MFRTSLATLVMAACGTLALAAPGNAATTLWEDVTVPLADNSWPQTLTLHKFDSSLGTLTAVSFRLSGEVWGKIEFENLVANSRTITSKLQGTLTLNSPSNTPLLTITPSETEIRTVSAWDGLTDFKGTSGQTFELTATSQVTGHDNTHLAFYDGTLGETFTVSLSALVQTSMTGSENLHTRTTPSTKAGGTVGVQYEYTPLGGTPVPEPASLALLGLGGVFGLAYRRRRRTADR